VLTDDVPAPGVVEKLISGKSLNSKSMKSAKTESESFRGVIGACRGISLRKMEGDGTG